MSIVPEPIWLDDLDNPESPLADPKVWKRIARERLANGYYLRITRLDLERQSEGMPITYGVDRDILKALQNPSVALRTDPVLVQDAIQNSSLPITIMPGAFLELWRDLAKVVSKYSEDRTTAAFASTVLNTNLPDRATLGDLSRVITSQNSFESLMGSMPRSVLTHIARDFDFIADFVTRPNYVSLGHAVSSLGSAPLSLDVESFEETVALLASHSEQRQLTEVNNEADALTWHFMLAFNDASVDRESSSCLALFTNTNAYETVQAHFPWETDPLFRILPDYPNTLLRKSKSMLFINIVTGYGSVSREVAYGRLEAMSSACHSAERVSNNFVEFQGLRARDEQIGAWSLRRQFSAHLGMVMPIVRKEIIDAFMEPLTRRAEFLIQQNDDYVARHRKGQRVEQGSPTPPVDFAKAVADAALCLQVLSQELEDGFAPVLDKLAGSGLRAPRFWLAQPIAKVIGVEHEIEAVDEGLRLTVRIGGTKPPVLVCYYLSQNGAYNLVWSSYCGLEAFEMCLKTYFPEGAKQTGTEDRVAFVTDDTRIMLDANPIAGQAPRATITASRLQIEPIAKLVARTTPMALPSTVLVDILKDLVARQGGPN